MIKWAVFLFSSAECFPKAGGCKEETSVFAVEGTCDTSSDQGASVALSSALRRSEMSEDCRGSEVAAAPPGVSLLVS